MFASSGYFRGLTCPYFASGLCERKYCHFRHIKQPDDANHGKIKMKNLELEASKMHVLSIMFFVNVSVICCWDWVARIAE